MTDGFRGTNEHRHPWFHLPPHHKRVRVQWTTNYGLRSRRGQSALWFVHER